MKITGTVVYQSIEGGFWGIAGDDGEKYRPIHELPAEAQTDGCRVEADLEPVEMVSFTMWGRNVKVRTIKVL
jgi:hypothetical protein